jgi:ferredoxin-NADP reductase
LYSCWAAVDSVSCGRPAGSGGRQSALCSVFGSIGEHIAATKALRIRREQEQLHWNGYRQFRVKQKVVEGDNICSFYLVPHDAKPLPAFRPGQFMTFRFSLLGKKPGEFQKVVRCYSLSDSPRSEQFRITVKRVPAVDATCAPGLVSNHLCNEVEAGDILDVQAPRGGFAIDPEGDRPIVLIGGGIGVTPLISMVNSISTAESKRDVWLFYGVRDGGEHVMKQHLEQLAAAHDRFHLQVFYSRPDSQDDSNDVCYHEGHVSVERIRESVKVFNCDFYVCGPSAMMQSIIPALKEWGVEESRIHIEAFGPATLPQQSRPKPPAGNAVQLDGQRNSFVEFSQSSKTVAWDDGCPSLLDFALSHGVDIDSECRAGSCGSCAVAITKGRVFNISEPSGGYHEGSCLACISVPDGSLVLDI